MATEQLSLPRSILIVAVFTTFSIAWILFSDIATALFFTDAASLAVVGSIKGVLYVLISAALIYRMLRGPGTKAAGQARKRSAWELLSVISVVVGVGLAMVFALIVVHRAERERVVELLEVVSSMKAQVADRAMSEREDDAQHLLGEIAGMATSALDLESLSRQSDTVAPYEQLAWVGRSGEVEQATTPALIGALSSELQAAATMAIQSGRDVWASQFDAETHDLKLFLMVPAPQRGLLILQFDASSIFKLELDGTSSIAPSLDAALVSPRKGKVMFLAGSGLISRWLSRLDPSLNNETLLTARVLRRELPLAEVAEATDYRGQQVLGIVREVGQGRSIYILYKIDKAELYRSVAAESAWIGFCGAALMVAIFSLMAMRKQQTIAAHARHQATIGQLEAQSAQSLTEALDALKAAQSIARTGSWTWHTGENDAHCSEEMSRILDIPVGMPLSFRELRARILPEDRALLHAAWRSAADSGHAEFEHRIQRHGSVRWLAQRISIQRDPDGRLAAAMGTVQDITDRKDLEQRLESGERRLRIAQEAGRVGVWERNPHDGTAYWSPQAERLYGVSPGTLTSVERWRQCLLPEDIDRIDGVLHDAIALGRPIDIEFPIPLPDGSVRWVRSVGAARCDGEGQAVQVSGVIFETTELRAKEERLTTQAHWLQVIGHVAADFAYVRTEQEFATCFEQMSESLASILMCDRAYLFALSPDESTLANTHEWCADGIEHQIDSLGCVRAEEMPWFFPQMLEGNVFDVEDVEKMPAEASAEQNIFRMQDIRSLICFPIHADGGRVAGFTGFDFVRTRHQWVPELKAILGIAADVVGGVQARVIARAQLMDERLQLKAANDRLRKLASRVPGMVYQYQLWPDGRSAFPYSSDGIRDIYDVLPQDVADDASCVLAMLHPDDISRAMDCIQRSADTLTTWRDSYRVVRANGQVCWLEGEAEPEAMSDGSVLWHGHIRDITARSIAEQHMRNLSKAIEQSPESIVITNLDGAIEFVNEAFVQTTGYSPQEVIGKNPRILQSGQTPRATYEAMWRTLTAGESWRGELRNRRKTGEQYIEYAVITPVRDEQGKITNYLAIKDDITEKKRMGEELTAYRNHLEELVAERTEQLAEARSRAEAANVAKTSFLANMSHEIRTPLNAILGISHLLGRGRLDERQTRQLRQLEQSSTHLLGLINDILDLSKIESGHLVLESRPFSLKEMMGEVVSILSPSVAAKRLAMRQEIDCAQDWFIGDATRIRQALINFANNAVKFTSAGSIRLRCEQVVEREGRAQLKFSVIDTGIGVDPEALPRLFKPFEQADSSITRRFGGSGLGLAIVRHFAAMMGGQAGVESEKGKGSTFWFTVWLLSPSSSSQALKAIRPETVHGTVEAFERRSVLLVEDNEISREVGCEILEDLGLKVEVACNGREAIHKVAEGRFDLVFMDMQMPELDGLSATAEIRKLAGCESLPIVAMTANVFEEDRQACLAAGMNDFLGKPIQLDSLSGMLAKWLPKGSVRVRMAASPSTGDMPIGLERLMPLLASGQVDKSRVSLLARGDADKFIAFLQQFLDAHHSDVDKLRSGLAGGSPELVRQVAHALKGAAANLGLAELADMAKSLELQARSATSWPPSDPVHAALPDRIQVAFDSLSSTLAGIVAQGVESAPLALDRASLDKVLEQLRELLVTSDARTVSLFNEYKSALAPSFGQRMSEMAAAVASFDFPTALHIMDATLGTAAGRQ